jgi:GNAT superfamily N-acetyltransferase
MNNSQPSFIRRARSDDGEAIFHLAECCATSFAVEPAAFHSSLPQLLADPSACLLVAELDGAVVGYVLGFEHLAFYANGRVAHVEEIMVAERLRQRGIGSRLMDAFTLWARTRECRLIALATRRAAEFYRSLGYEDSATYFRKLL